MIPGFTNLMPDTLTLALFWVSYVLLFVGVVIIKGYQLMLTDGHVNIWNSVKSVFFFVGGNIAMVILTWLFNTLDSISFLAGAVGQILWFFYLITIALITVVLPLYINFNEAEGA